MQTSRSAAGLVGAALQVLLLTVPAIGQETTRVSVDSSGAEGDNVSDDEGPSISANGQFVAFSSYASNLVAGDTNGVWDVFVHDRATGITERVSVDSSGGEGNGKSPIAEISADGQIVAFASGASNLVAGDTNGACDVFVHDRATKTTERVSVRSNGNQGNAESASPSISGDGQVVAFRSAASNLVAFDTNGVWDVFVHNRATGNTKRVSVDSSGVQGNSYSVYTAISADGQVVAFESLSSNLVAGDTNRDYDVFVHHRATGITERVSVDSSGGQGNDYSYWPSLSADGQIAAFYSKANNFVAGDTNGYPDVFVHDRATGITQRVSVDSSGAEGNDDSGYDGLSLSTNGQVVAFGSVASNLVAGDTNGAQDVFVHERCDATWSNYGAGFPGTNGVPSFTSRADPVLGTTVTLDLANSYGNATVGLLIIGLQRTTIHTNWGSDVLADPLITRVLVLPASGASLSDLIPNDDDLCGFTLDLQAIEADPGAAKGVSFTPGLELVLGH